VDAAVQRTVDHFGRIDALVNNAGVAVFKPIGETSFHEWRTVMATNLDGAFLMTQAVVPVMLEQGGGAVVNIASISGLRASTLRVAYGTSKAALIHLTKQQAVEYGNAGVRVNAIAPGPVETAMAKAVHTPAIRADYHDTIPLARYGSEEEIANAIGFLCSPQASYVNGQVLAVDGGFDAAGVGLPTTTRPTHASQSTSPARQPPSRRSHGRQFQARHHRHAGPDREPGAGAPPLPQPGPVHARPHERQQELCGLAAVGRGDDRRHRG
jgi:enoyl-[acyl-carrier-protein] reductase (NADH)